jgi:hypothetical protein
VNAWPPDPDVERANALDRAYFEAHPGDTVYYRAPISGEFDQRIDERVYLLRDTSEYALVRVDLIAPGVRVRTGLTFIIRTI